MTTGESKSMNLLPRTATAYLCVMHRLENKIPKFIGFEISSSLPWTMSAGAGWFGTIYYQISAPTYDEAHKQLVELCRTYEPMAWIWPWIDPSREAHNRRFDLQKEAGIRK
jgi:hypothetical protein